MDEMVEMASSTKLWPPQCIEQHNVKKLFPKCVFDTLRDAIYLTPLCQCQCQMKQ